MLLGAGGVRADIGMSSVEHTSDEALNLLPPALIYDPSDAEIDSITAYVQWLMDRDRKSTGLKSLQGKIWEQGYRDGTLTSQVFTDVPAALACWQRVGLRVSIFSSGSVLAQKLLFAHTDAGDLTKFLDSYFDTTTGAKTVAESYRRITAGIPLSPATN